MFTTIINDSRDDNARGRQESRAGSFYDTAVSFIGVDSDLEAGMQLIDILDATAGHEGLILVNVAPRGGHTVKWENGTPFAYFWHEKTLVISSLDGYAFSGVKKLGVINEVNVLDIHESVKIMQDTGFITAEEAERVPHSQFRSFDFTPRAGAFMIQGNNLPGEIYDLDQVPDLPPAIWNIDSFGNSKTTVLPTDIRTDGQTLTRYGELPYYEKLRDVPDHQTALVRGSSGLNDTRFIEVLTQRKDFAKHHNAKIGYDIFSEKSYFKKATE